MAKVDIRFILEWQQPGRPTRMMVLPPVSRYVPAMAPATDREWTLGDEPVKQKMGYRELPISLAGISGYKRSRAHDANGVEIQANGIKRFEEFVKFLLEYEEEGKRKEGPFTRDMETRPRLVFRSMQDTATSEAWYVEVSQFTPVRDVESARLIRAFTLDLLTEGMVRDVRAGRLLGTPAQQVAGNAKTSAMLKDALKKTPPSDGFIDSVFTTGTVEGSVSAGSDAVSEGGGLASLQDFVDDTPARWQRFRLPVGDYLRTCQSVKEGAAAVRGLARFPQNIIHDLADMAQGTLDVLEAVYDAIPGPTNRAEAREVFIDVHQTIEAMRSNALQQLGLAGAKYTAREDGISASPAISEGVTASSGQEVISAQIQQGETLPAFAYRVLGDPARWAEIVELNDLASPFAGPDGGPLGGLTLLVPAASGLLGDRDPAVLFGVDVQMDGSDIVLDGTTDFALVRGRANLEQALTRRLLTREGQSIAFPLLGLPPLVGQPGVAGTAAYIASRLQEQMLRDGRVRKVFDVTVEQNGGRYEASFSVQTVAGDTIPVTAPFPS